MANCRARAEEVKDEPGHILTYYVRKQGSVQRRMEACQKDREASVNGLPLTKLGKITYLYKVRIATSYKPLNKMETMSLCYKYMNKLRI